MSRVIKFRAYSAFDKAFHYFSYDDYPQGIYGGLSEPQQFTGLLDKEGREIYEGDILEVEGVPVWDRYETVYAAVEHDSSTGGYQASRVIYGMTDRRPQQFFRGKVVGNIHQHPHLLS